MPKTSKAHLQANSKWQKENTTSFTVRMNNTDYEPLQEYLESHADISRNAFINAAIKEKLARDQINNI
jgi:type III secretory pathway component EscR